MMIRLRQILMAHLRSIHPRVDYQVASDELEFPYLVADCVSARDDGEGFRIVEVDVDGWDNKDDTTVLEKLMACVNAGLNKRTLRAEELVVTFYLDRILSLTDEDPSLRRRRLVFQAHVFERS